MFPEGCTQAKMTCADFIYAVLRIADNSVCFYDCFKVWEAVFDRYRAKRVNKQFKRAV
jgi:hypothetical protein